MVKINLTSKLTRISDCWQPKVIAELNDYQIKLAHIEGEFVWHSHSDTDEYFQCLEGEFEMHFRDRIEHISAGDVIVVPKGVEHKPVAKRRSAILLIEPRGVVNTGDAQSELTAQQDQWI